MPKGSICPWVNAQYGLTYFNDGPGACSDPQRVNGLDVSSEPNLWGFLSCTMVSLVLRKEAEFTTSEEKKKLCCFMSRG